MANPFLLDPMKIIFTILISFIPAIIYAVIVRYSEKYEREPWGSIGQAFLWGGTLAIVIVILIRGFFSVYLEDNYPVIASDIQYKTLIIMCLITPLVAELIKPIGLLLVRADLLEAEDGLIYGAVIGLGFTATENLLFGIYLAPLYGIEMFVTVVFMRSMSVMFIQSSTTALTCYGITRAMKVKHKTGRFYAFPLFLLAAIGIHSLFNYIVFSDIFNIGDILFSMSSSLLFSIIFAFVLMTMIYFKIYRLDRIDEKTQQEARREVHEVPPEHEVYEQNRFREVTHPPHDTYYDYDRYYGPEQYPPHRPPPPRSRDFHYMYEPPARVPAPRRVPPPMRVRRPPPSKPTRQHYGTRVPPPRPPRSIPPPPPPPPPPATPQHAQDITIHPPKKKKKIIEFVEEPKDAEDVEVDWDA